jgi:hypothetical protein
MTPILMCGNFRSIEWHYEISWDYPFKTFLKFKARLWLRLIKLKKNLNTFLAPRFWLWNTDTNIKTKKIDKKIHGIIRVLDKGYLRCKGDDVWLIRRYSHRSSPVASTWVNTPNWENVNLQRDEGGGGSEERQGSIVLYFNEKKKLWRRKDERRRWQSMHYLVVL